MNKTCSLSFLMMAAVWATILPVRSFELRVNMVNQLKVGLFRPQYGDKVLVRGSMNNWAGEEFVLTDQDSDGVYTGTASVDISNEQVEFKYVIVAGGGRKIPNGGWETSKNRRASIRGSSLPVHFFNDLNIVFPFAVRLKVSMSNQIVQGVFLPNKGDKIVVRGNFNSWFGIDHELSDQDKDGVYEIRLRGYSPNKEIEFKFVIVAENKRPLPNEGWEVTLNRHVPVHRVGNVTPVLYFNDQKTVAVFRVDMRKQINSGKFDTAKGDSVAIKVTVKGRTDISEFMKQDSIAGLFVLPLCFGGDGGKITYRYCILNHTRRAYVPEVIDRELTLSTSGLNLRIENFRDSKD